MMNNRAYYSIAVSIQDDQGGDWENYAERIDMYNESDKFLFFDSCTQ